MKNKSDKLFEMLPPALRTTKASAHGYQLYFGSVNDRRTSYFNLQEITRLHTEIQTSICILFSLIS